jgi:hypothetical protein
VANAFRKHFFRIAALLFLGAALTGVILSFAGPEITDAMLPAAKRIVACLHPDYDIHEIRIERDIKPERVVFTAIKDTPGGGTMFVNSVRGLPFTGYFTVNSGYTLPMIAFALLIAWPYLPFPRKLTVIPLMFLLLVVIWLFDISLCVIGGIESGSRRIIDVAGSHTLQQRLEAFGYSFLITGGRQFLGILAFCLAVAPFHLIRGKSHNNNVQPNDPCPCGSGRKFRKCCGR